MQNKNISKSNLKSIFIIIFVGIFLFTLLKILITQEEKIKYYNIEYEHLSSKQKKLLNDKENLLKKKEIVNTDEYIENIAREKCNMYKPNERVYININ